MWRRPVRELTIGRDRARLVATGERPHRRSSTARFFPEHKIPGGDVAGTGENLTLTRFRARRGAGSGFLFWRLLDAGRQSVRPQLLAAGIRNRKSGPFHEILCAGLVIVA